MLDVSSKIWSNKLQLHLLQGGLGSKVTVEMVVIEWSRCEQAIDLLGNISRHHQWWCVNCELPVDPHLDCSHNPLCTGCPNAPVTLSSLPRSTHWLPELDCIGAFTAYCYDTLKNYTFVCIFQECNHKNRVLHRLAVEQKHFTHLRSNTMLDIF